MMELFYENSSRLKAADYVSKKLYGKYIKYIPEVQQKTSR